MLDFFQHLLFWHWFALAAVLLIIEVLTGSGFLLWIGISAGLVGCLLVVFPELNILVQWITFAVLSVFTALGWRQHLKHHPIATDKPTLNRRGEQYVQRVFTLETPIINGIGSIHVDDTVWRIRCVDLPAGARIKIIGVDGVFLLAEPNR